LSVATCAVATGKHARRDLAPMNPTRPPRNKRRRAGTPRAGARYPSAAVVDATGIQRDHCRALTTASPPPLQERAGEWRQNIERLLSRRCSRYPVTANKKKNVALLGTDALIPASRRAPPMAPRFATATDTAKRVLRPAHLNSQVPKRLSQIFRNSTTTARQHT
jgi:hypothetical protein